MDGVGKRHQFVEHLRTVGQFVVVLAVLVQQSDGLAVAALGIVEFLHLPIDISQSQQQYPLLDAISHRLLITLLIGGDGLCCVFLQHIDVTDGIVHLIQVFGIIVVDSHAFQLADHLSAVAISHHLCLSNAGIKLQFVGRVTCYHLPISLVGFILVAELVLYLTHQKPLPGSLHLAALVADGLAQIGYGLLIVARVDIIVSVSIVPVFHGAEVHRVAAHVPDHVLGIIHPP